MLVATEQTLTETIERWLGAFETALSGGDDGGGGDALGKLFCDHSHWRDLLAFTWHIQTVSGAASVVEALTHFGTDAGASGFEIDTDRTPPRIVTRTGIEIIEAIFKFRTACGSATGVVRLMRNDGHEGGHDDKALPRAWTLLTALDEIEGFKETVGTARPSGEAYSRDFRGPNWLDRRQSTESFADRDPAVLVVGGGQAGLSIAARLTQLNVDTLIVDREHRVGDNWRNRYHALSLHNQVHVNHLPYMPFPPNWPTYIPKDKLAGWFESYAEIMELNVWTGTDFTGGTYDEKAGHWMVGLRMADGTTREMHPRHVIMATGVSDIPNVPDIPSLKDFGGTILHSSDFGQGADWAGRTALILGTGTSGHDIAQDLHSHGAKTTMVQRSPTLIVGIEPSAQLPYVLYGEGPPLADCDLLTTSFPFKMLKNFHQQITKQTKIHDKALLDGLAKIGFKLDFGEDDTGWQFKYLQRGGGYYFNVGCSDLLLERKIGLVQFEDIERFAANGARLKNGDELTADLIVLATGYKGQDYLVRQLFGEAIADRVGPIWGFDPAQQELRNMWVRTGQPGLWFIAGSFAQCRIYSKFLGLQIKAAEQGLIPLVR